MLKISYAGCLGLSSGILSQFILKMCAAAKKCQKNTRNLFWSSRSFKVIHVDKSKKPITIVCYDNQHVCAYLQPFTRYTSHYRQNNHFLGGNRL